MPQRNPPLARLATLALAALLTAAPAGQATGRTFYRLPIAKIAKAPPGANLPTHAEVVGVVAFVRMEADGDRHLRVCEPGAAGVCLVVECVPELAAVMADCKRVRLTQTVRVRGITRRDNGHGWWELHPVLGIEVVR